MLKFEISELNEWIFKRSLRQYQLLICQNAQFSINFEGKDYTFYFCSANNGVNELIFNGVEHHSSLLIKSRPIAKGFDLDISTLSYSDERYNEELVTTNIVVRVGHPNFAHFIWNQLDALLRLQIFLGSDIYVLQDVDTILNVGNLPGFKLVKESHIKSECTIFVGSQIVTELVRTAIFSTLPAFGKFWSERAKNLSINQICLGVRGPGKRELTNEVDFYVALIRSFDSKAEVTFFLDGFTIQHDSYNAVCLNKRQEACEYRIKQIIMKCPEYQIINLNGILIDDFIVIAKGFTFYCTHAGTMHHKIGWLFPSKPSFLLVGGRYPASSVKWHRDQSEFGSEIQYLPPELYLLRDISDPGLEKSSERNLNLTISDVNSSINYIRTILNSTVLAM